MSARVYLMKRLKDCQDVSIMSPQDEQWIRTNLPTLFVYCNYNRVIKNYLKDDIEFVTEFICLLGHPVQ